MTRGVASAVLLFAALSAGAALTPVGGGRADSASPGQLARYPAIDLSAWSAEPPERPLRLLFVHHSIGAQLLADEGADVARDGIKVSHPNGGGARALLTQAGYHVHEASAGSRVGEHTDIFDWLPKFRDQMDELLRVRRQDELLPPGEQNDIVVFKSCFPNSLLQGVGDEPVSPVGPARTLANVKATMRALLPYFAARRDVLFVFATTPPAAPVLESVPAWKWALKQALGRSFGVDELRRSGELSRELNRWLQAPDGWLAGYPGSNVVVWDYWDQLTGEGKSNLLVYANGDGRDAHPTAEANRRAAPRFVETINRAVRRAHLIDVARPGDERAGL